MYIIHIGTAIIAAVPPEARYIARFEKEPGRKMDTEAARS